jgi:parallel beta-helix repeat protein
MSTFGTQVRNTVIFGAVACIALGLIFAPGASAGELEPPVPPGTPTMKPLNELEPRRPIFTEMLPLTISEPGSYYLAGPISTSGEGITIDSSYVTIDLNGFMLKGGTGSGISVAEWSSHEGIVIRDGFITNWSDWGIDLAYSLAGTQSVEILDVHLLRNGNGMRMYGESGIHRCAALYNNGIGIDAGFDSIVTDCVVRGTKTGTALIIGSGTIVTRAEIRGNEGGGVVMGEGAQLLESTVSSNDGHGIDATGDAAMIRNNMVFHNDFDGIRVRNFSFVRGNLCARNGGAVDDGAGIRLMNDSNRIEDNHLKSNDIGLYIHGEENTILKNSMDGNTQNWGRDPGVTRWIFMIWNVASPELPTAWSNMEDSSLMSAP